MFRYTMIGRTGCCWVDADILCLEKPDFAGEEIVFGRQSEVRGESVINNAVLKLPPADPTLNELIAKAEGAARRRSELGRPRSVPADADRDAQRHRSLRARLHRLLSRRTRSFWKLFLPAYRDEVARDVRGATFLHLWGELIARSGYDRSRLPPAGSFLDEALARLGVLDRFAGAYEAGEVAALTARWISAKGSPNRAVPTAAVAIRTAATSAARVRRRRDLRRSPRWRG